MSNPCRALAGRTSSRPIRAWSPVRELSVLASSASVACVFLSLAAPALPSPARGRAHLHETPIPHDRDRVCLPHSGRYLTRTREGSSRLCDRWRSHAPLENPWVEALTSCLRASPIPFLVSACGIAKRPCFINGLEK